MYEQYKTIFYVILARAAANTASSIYSAAAISIAPAITTQAAVPSPIAVVAQGRAPAKEDMGATPIYGILCHWCPSGTMTTNPYHYDNGS